MSQGRAWLVDLGTLDGSASANSSKIESQYATAFTVQAVVTGSNAPVATLQVQASNDVPSSITMPFTLTNWFDVTGASLAINADGVYGSPLTEIAYRFIRFALTVAGGDAGDVAITVQMQGR